MSYHKASGTLPKASIIIPSRGGATRIPRLVDALKSQTCTEWEAIFVIDGDIDNSAGVLERYHDLPLRTIVFPENRGRVAALNAGFAAATGEILIRCDDDLEPDENYVHNHINAHATQHCGAIGIYMNVLADNDYSRVFGYAADARFRQNAYNASEDTKWLYWAGNCSIDRTVWETVGPYDSSYRAYGWEDVDYGLRIWRAGFPIVIDPLLETVHHAAAVDTGSRIRRAYRSGQARRIFDGLHGKSIKGPGPTRPKNDSLWNITANALSFTLNYNRAGKLADMVDKMLLPRAPRRVSAKVVALLVETAAVSGYANEETPTNDI